MGLRIGSSSSGPSLCCITIKVNALCVFSSIPQGKYQHSRFFGKIQLCPDVGKNSASVTNRVKCVQLRH